MRLQHNDLISFGFSTSKVYNIRDKNAFIYRVMKDDIETIDLNDSEEDDVDTSAVIEIDSGSDDELSPANEAEESENTDSELQDIDDDIVISSDDGGDIYEENGEDEMPEDEGSSDSGGFVVTDVIVNEGMGAEGSGADSSPKSAKVADALTEATSEPADTGKDEVIMSVTTNPNANDFQSRVDRVKQSVNAKRQKKAAFISAQPIKKRRRTVTEVEYESMNTLRAAKRINPMALQKAVGTSSDKQLLAQKRAERLAQVAQEQKEAKKALNGQDDGIKRAVVTPRVKNSQVSRAEMLTIEMLAAEESAK